MIQFQNKNMSPAENRIVERLVADILAAGLTISVFDGEAYPLRYSTDPKAIFEAMASTDMDELVLHEPLNAQRLRMRIGSIVLVWGNDNDVLADWGYGIDHLVRGALALSNYVDDVARGFRKPFAPNTTARFWVYVNSGVAVLIKLGKGESRSYVEGGQTDEGYSYTGRTWEFDGEEVRVSWAENARDCDGVIHRSGSSYCPLADLKAGYHCPDHEPSIVFPKWRERGYEQRDYSAEAAGY